MKIKFVYFFSAMGLIFSATAAMAGPEPGHAYDFGQPGDPQAVDSRNE